MTNMITFFILAIVSFTAVFFGGIHVWAQSVMIFSIFGITAVSLWAWAINKASKRDDQAAKVIVDPVSIVGILFLLWTGLQLIPLPEGVLQFLSPNTKAAWETTGMAGGKGAFSISLYPYVTLNSLIFGTALLLFYWLALYGLQRRSLVHALISGLLILGTLVSLYALVQAGTASPYVLWWKNSYYPDYSTGTFVNRNHFAAFLSMLICLGIGYIWALGKEEEKGMGWGKSSGTRRVIVLLGVALMMAALLGRGEDGRDASNVFLWRHFV
jgi:putative inorganic carbon (HCO3(-)) transporter